MNRPLPPQKKRRSKEKIEAGKNTKHVREQYIIHILSAEITKYPTAIVGYSLSPCPAVVWFGAWCTKIWTRQITPTRTLIAGYVATTAEPPAWLVNASRPVCMA